ncbi:MAG: glycerophosphodiester phosphodiesterase [Alphaproteobacteria bacterium]
MIKVLGHRGVRQRKDIDENSLPAFEKAFQNSNGIETDAAVSGDGTTYLVHDVSQFAIPHLYARARYALKEHLDKISAKLMGKKRLDQVKDNEIDKLRLKKGGKLPKLSELFDLAAKYPGKTINIELKGHNSVGPVLAEINAAIKSKKIKKSQIILTSFDHLSIKKVRELDPEIKCGFIFARYSKGRTRIYPWTDNKISRYIQFSKKVLKSKTAKEVNPDYFIMTAGAISTRKMKQLHKFFPNAKIMLWTTKKPEKDRALNKKLKNKEITPHIEAIITDFPEKMAKHLAKKGL